MTQNTPTALEGRILAHRRILARLISALPDDDRESMMQWMEQREVMRDGQEDPGAVQSEGNALELAMADEFNRVSIVVADRLAEKGRP